MSWSVILTLWVKTSNNSHEYDQELCFQEYLHTVRTYLLSFHGSDAADPVLCRRVSQPGRFIHSRSEVFPQTPASQILRRSDRLAEQIRKGRNLVYIGYPKRARTQSLVRRVNPYGVTWGFPGLCSFWHPEPWPRDGLCWKQLKQEGAWIPSGRPCPHE